MKLDRSGDWQHVDAKDGDKPVLAERLLPKRLIGLHPSLRKERERGKSRNLQIWGLRFVGSKNEAKSDPTPEPFVPF